MVTAHGLYLEDFTHASLISSFTFSYWPTSLLGARTPKMLKAWSLPLRVPESSGLRKTHKQRVGLSRFDAGHRYVQKR